MKIVLDWTLLAISLLFCIAGLTFMWNGWEIILNERGWASFIVGAVLLSGGLVASSVVWSLIRLRESFRIHAQSVFSAPGHDHLSPQPDSAQDHPPTLQHPDFAAYGKPRRNDAIMTTAQDNRAVAVAVATGAVAAAGAAVAQAWSNASNASLNHENRESNLAQQPEHDHPHLEGEADAQSSEDRLASLDQGDVLIEHGHETADHETADQDPSADSLSSQTEQAASAFAPEAPQAMEPDPLASDTVQLSPATKKSRRPLISALLKGKSFRSETESSITSDTLFPSDETDPLHDHSAPESAIAPIYPDTPNTYDPKPPAPRMLGMDAAPDVSTHPQDLTQPDLLEDDPLMADPDFASYVRETTRPNAPWSMIVEPPVSEPAMANPPESALHAEPSSAYETSAAAYDTSAAIQEPFPQSHEDAWMNHPDENLDRELGRAGLAPHNAAIDAQSTGGAPAEVREGSSIVGRYASGDTTYVMFADGSIEAETPDGVLRFASISELRHFIEARP